MDVEIFLSTSKNDKKLILFTFFVFLQTSATTSIPKIQQCQIIQKKVGLRHTHYIIIIIIFIIPKLNVCVCHHI
jgi:hypothetical protein